MHRGWSWLVLASAAMGTGCGDKEGEGVIPTAGMWLYGTVAYGEDGCGLEGSLLYRDVLIDQVDGDGFRYIDTNGDALTCALGSGGDFSCAPLSRTVDYTSNGTDAVLTFVLASEGRFGSETALERTARLEGSCVGSACDLFGSVSFPCVTTVEMDAAYEGPAEALDTAFGG